MKRTLDAIAAIQAIGYPSNACVQECTCDELPCPLFTWLVTELRAACPEFKGKGCDVVLMGELRDLLGDLLCPYDLLTGGASEPDVLHRITEFLVSELQAVRILRYKELHPEDKTTEAEAEKEQRVAALSPEHTECSQTLHEGDHTTGQSQRRAEAQAEIPVLLEALDMDPSSRLSDVLDEVKSRVALLPSGEMAGPLLNNSLNLRQWMQVEKINETLSKDYQCRREMMVKRFQVTLQSFAWGEKEKERGEALASVPPLASFARSSKVCLSLLLATRDDQSCILPVKAGPSTQVYKVLMGNVPDRGGRPGEIEPPMPAWEGRREHGGRWGRGGGGRQRQKFSGKKRKGKKE